MKYQLWWEVLKEEHTTLRCLCLYPVPLPWSYLFCWYLYLMLVFFTLSWVTTVALANEKPSPLALPTWPLLHSSLDRAFQSTWDHIPAIQRTISKWCLCFIQLSLLHSTQLYIAYEIRKWCGLSRRWGIKPEKLINLSICGGCIPLYGSGIN